MKNGYSIKFFGLNNISLESHIKSIEEEFDVDLGHRSSGLDIERNYYPQFDNDIRQEADKMSRNYIIFYCLENSIREIIVDRLSATDQFGVDWWNKSVPDVIRQNAERNYKKELSSGVRMRSSEMIDYTNFGELGEVIKKNWNIFGDMFKDIKAVEKIMASLNTLRAPIAHCKALAEDEETRLHLTLRDWFRQME